MRTGRVGRGSPLLAHLATEVGRERGERENLSLFSFFIIYMLVYFLYKENHFFLLILISKNSKKIQKNVNFIMEVNLFN